MKLQYFLVGLAPFLQPRQLETRFRNSLLWRGIAQPTRTTRKQDDTLGESKDCERQHDVLFIVGRSTRRYRRCRRAVAEFVSPESCFCTRSYAF